jgi:DeoR family transcriptional regulator, suf operon transcriptional repressor
VVQLDVPNGVQTEGKLLALLCERDHTTPELADALGMSSNAVRWHLGRLERMGWITHTRQRGGVGKPPNQYRLTAEGSVQLSRAYLPMLSALLDAVAAAGGPASEEALLRSAGAALASRDSHAAEELRTRIDAAAGLLHRLGGVSTVRQEADAVWIESYCCPLRAVVQKHPLACKAIEAMVAEVTGAPVQERCTRDASPRCRLQVSLGQ